MKRPEILEEFNFVDIFIQNLIEKFTPEKKRINVIFPTCILHLQLDSVKSDFAEKIKTEFSAARGENVAFKSGEKKFPSSEKSISSSSSIR